MEKKAAGRVCRCFRTGTSCNRMKTLMLVFAVLLVIALGVSFSVSAERIEDRPFRELEHERRHRDRGLEMEKEPPLRGALIMSKTNAPEAWSTNAAAAHAMLLDTNLPPAVLREIVESLRDEQLCLGSRHDWSVRVGEMRFGIVEGSGPRTIVLVGGRIANVPVSAFTFVGILTLATLFVAVIALSRRRV